MNVVESLRHFVPELTLLGGAFIALFMDLFIRRKRIVGFFCLAITALTLCLLEKPSQPLSLFYGFFYLDPFAHFFRYLALISVAFALWFAGRYSPLRDRYEGEFYGLFLLMAFALILVGCANNLLMIFLSVEFVSLISYILTGFLKQDVKSKEAAIKYLLFGSVASAIMLYGMSLVYGISGSLELPVIGKAFSSSFSPLGKIAVLFFFAGLGFKISMAPFHMWAPDVYEGAPTPVTAFLTVGPKALGFAVLIRVLATIFSPLTSEWTPILTLLSILTMTLGNITAISQNNIKRFLAYSSIAQAGYILMGLAVFSSVGLQGVLIYLLAYLFTNLGAFAIVLLVSEATGSEQIEDYAGLSKRSPLIAAFFAVFLLSLTGIPPLAGFIGKFYVFAGAIEAKAFTLAIAAIINSAIAAYYYFRIIRLMYLAPAPQHTVFHPSSSLLLSAGILFVGTVMIGTVPGPFISWVKTAFLFLN